MRLPSLGLRAGIIAQLSFLILIAMLLCDVVMIKFAERDLLKARVDAGRLLAASLRGLHGESGAIPAEKAGPLLEAAGFSSAFMVDRDGKVLAEAGSITDGDRRRAVLGAMDSLRTGAEGAAFTGRAWAVIRPGPEVLRLSFPAANTGRDKRSVIVLNTSLVPMYKELRKSQRMILIYIILDTAVLALAGTLLLSRNVVRPIRRLLRMTEEYTEGDFRVPLERDSGSEIRMLSRSLGNMLNRLDRNKQELKDHIDSLERANEELREAQNSILRSEKLASVGRLAAGVAHEIGNPISIILGYLEMLARPDISDAERADFLGRVESEILRINRIIRTLLDFSRSSEERPGTVSVHALLADTVEVLEVQPLMEGLKIHMKCEGREDCVCADEGRLRQVFLNILMNAVDGVTGDQGRDRKQDATIQIWTGSRDGEIEVRITDNGRGISRENLPKVFDPFYTTKDPGKGTGLGLSVSHRIIEDMGGSLCIESRPGRETTVIVRLPLIKSGEGGQ